MITDDEAYVLMRALNKVGVTVSLDVALKAIYAVDKYRVDWLQAQVEYWRKQSQPDKMNGE